MSRTADIQSWIDGEHFRYSLSATQGDLPGYLKISNLRWKQGFTPGPVLEIGLRDFNRFMQNCLSISSDPEAEVGTDLLFEIDPALPSSGFKTEIDTGQIKVCAAGERGLVEALHYLERELADRGGPWLPPGVHERFPTLQTRFSEGIFIPAHQNADCFGDLSDEYLGLMTHYGANALKATYRINDLWRSETLSECGVSEVNLTN